MITITDQAAEQIKKSVEQSSENNSPLRIAAKINDDGSFEYGMGFDDPKKEDMQLTINSIKIIISNVCKELLEDATLDFVEIEPGDLQFIFSNPNDPTYKAPKK